MVTMNGVQPRRRSPWRRVFLTGCISWSICIYIIVMQPPEKKAAIWMRVSSAFRDASGIGEFLQDPQGHLQYVMEQDFVKLLSLCVLLKLLARFFRSRVERAAEAEEDEKKKA